jgi:hypothetical protein
MLVFRMPEARGLISLLVVWLLLGLQARFEAR